MIEGLAAYPEMKDSGVEWLGEIPAHWEIRRAKALFREVDVRTSTGTEPLLSLRQAAGLVDHHASGGREIPAEALVRYKRVTPGQMVMNRMRASVGLFAVARTTGLVSPDYATFAVARQVSAVFFVHLFKTPIMGSVFRAESKGLGTGESGFLRLYSDQFGRLACPVPPPDEQAAIVRFLDHADRRIRRYIRAKQNLIKLLEEQKQAIVHRAVTRGLDPGVRMKDSGVEWLGEVPAHWEVLSIARFARVGNGSTPSRSNPGYWGGGTYPWLNSSSANLGVVTQAEQFVTPLALKECHLPIVPEGSVVVAITGQGKTRGRAAVLRFETTINQHLAFVTPRPSRCSGDFLQRALTGAYSELRRISDDAGGTKGALTCADVKRFKVALPPLEEQNALVRRVVRMTEDLERALAGAHREITLLRELRTRLVSDVVTGKVDVRAAAAGLGEVGEEEDEGIGEEEDEEAEGEPGGEEEAA